MRDDNEPAHRLAAYTDAVFAVIVTVMVLELKAPEEAAFSALWPLWPTAISYAVSYLFIAVIWINHHYLMRFVGSPSLGLIWMNFVHLFLVSLLPFATAWIARTRLASSRGSVLRRALRVHRHCLQRLRARSPGSRGRHARARAYPAPGSAGARSSCSRSLRPRFWSRSSRRASPSV